ncbi:hypothetical protein AOLI_G00069510 [Acnodon oligacanthus]
MYLSLCVKRILEWLGQGCLSRMPTWCLHSSLNWTLGLIAEQDSKLAQDSWQTLAESSELDPAQMLIQVSGQALAEDSKLDLELVSVQEDPRVVGARVPEQDANLVPAQQPELDSGLDCWSKQDSELGPEPVQVCGLIHFSAQDADQALAQVYEPDSRLVDLHPLSQHSVLFLDHLLEQDSKLAQDSWQTLAESSELDPAQMLIQVSGQALAEDSKLDLELVSVQG